MFLKNNMIASEIATFVNGRLEGNPNVIITGLNGIADAQTGELTFYSDIKYQKYLTDTKASCILVPENTVHTLNECHTFIYVQNPYQSFIKIVNAIDAQKKQLSSFRHESAIISATATVHDSAYIGPNCFIGENCEIGEHTVLVANVAVYDDIKIGKNNHIHANVTICSDTIIGDYCLILPGAVIGSEGFGFVENKDGSYTKIPQIGNVIIGNSVEIGANSTIDRAMIGSTKIGDGVKIDNLVHIAHNCKVDENTAMAAQVGISGSAKIGKRNKFGGQVGVAGHLETADDVVLLARSGVGKTIAQPGLYFGAPARPRLDAFRIEAAIHTLPEMVQSIRSLKEEVKNLKAEK